jgi:hypothetical protein
MRDKLLKTVQSDIQEELIRTSQEYGYKPFNSTHEGYAVLKEEVEESEEELERIKSKLNIVWGAVRRDEFPSESIHLLKLHAELLACEAIQVAAMAQKFINLADK